MKFASACTIPSVGIVTTHNAIRVLSSSIKRKLRRRSAIEPVIGHLKIDGRLGRCQRHRNVTLTAVGHNLWRVLG